MVQNPATSSPGLAFLLATIDEYGEDGWQDYWTRLTETGVIESTCFRQVEFAGVLAGTEYPAEARMLVDFLASDTFQSELALNLFVYPANTTTALPQEFDDFAVVPDEPRSVDPADITANRSAWIDEWTTIVLG